MAFQSPLGGALRLDSFDPPPKPLRTHMLSSTLTPIVTPTRVLTKYPHGDSSAPLTLHFRVWFFHVQVIFYQPLFPKDAPSWHRI